jgi:hypothetical protein
MGAALSWTLLGAIAGLSLLTGCEPNEAGAGACIALGINWMPIWSWFATIVAICAFVMTPVLLIVATLSGVVCLVRRTW